MQPQFPSSPATVIVFRRQGNEEVWIGDTVYWERESTPTYVLTARALGEERYFPLGFLEETVPGQWEGILWDTDLRVLVRPTVESDAVTSVTMHGMPRVPMPIPVISSIHASSGEFLMPQLFAMSEDDGFVATMMLNTDAGLYVRYSGAWHLLTNEDAIDGLNVTEVADSALDMFDMFDRAGQLVALSNMQTRTGEPVDTSVVDTGVPGGTGTTSPVPVVSAATRTLPRLASADDLPSAIRAAMLDPDLQWWVSRRVKAMGIDAELPWE
jgi:hypothetical protein